MKGEVHHLYLEYLNILKPRIKGGKSEIAELGEGRAGVHPSQGWRVAFNRNQKMLNIPDLSCQSRGKSLSKTITAPCSEFNKLFYPGEICSSLGELQNGGWDNRGALTVQQIKCIWTLRNKWVTNERQRSNALFATSVSSNMRHSRVVNPCLGTPGYK